MGAHRVSWVLHFDAIPAGLYVLHSCDTPACVRPDHLFLGTNDENMADMVRKGRAIQGERHPNFGRDWLPSESRIRGEAHPNFGKRFGAPSPGEQNGNAKLTADDVRAIRRSYGGKRGEVARLAEEYGVRHSQISRILSRKTWAHLS